MTNITFICKMGHRITIPTDADPKKHIHFLNPDEIGLTEDCKGCDCLERVLVPDEKGEYNAANYCDVDVVKESAP